MLSRATLSVDSTMRIEIDRLEELGGKFGQVYEVDRLKLGDPDVRLTEPAKVSGRIRRNGNEIELRGELHAMVEAPCSRCLQPVELPIHADFVERFVPAVSWRAEAQHELQEQDLNLAAFDGEAIEIDDLVREEILLAMPAQVLCREDCKGLCPSCGIDRNTSNCRCAAGGEERWPQLGNLRF